MVVKGIILIKQLRLERILCTISSAENRVRALPHDRQGNQQNVQQTFYCAVYDNEHHII